MSASSKSNYLIAFLLCATLGSQLQAEEGRWVDPALDSQNLPQQGSLLSWQGDEQIIAYRNIDSLMATREIVAGSEPLRLPSKPRNFSEFRYSVDDEFYSLEDYLKHNHVAGLLVLKEGEILLEHYGLGNNDKSLWVTYSMAKSVVSMLFGAAIKDGYIGSVEDKVTDYLPQLKGSSYDKVSVRDLLQMASGVEWNEDYADPESDVANTPEELIEMYEYMGNLPRAFPPGEHFNYSTGETNLAGAVLRAAIGNNLATYLSHKVWQPFGMEADANWLTHGAGSGERGGCCISATLRDYGRLGLFAMGGGELADGSRVMPESWMTESTTASEGSEGYGYFWWLEGDGVYRAAGIYGQGIYINPAKDLVIVTLGAWNTAVGDEYGKHRDGFSAEVDSLFE